jgi:hypothetical protein
MEFIDIPTEQTTAATDLLLALVALASVVYLARVGKGRDPWKARIWSWAFGLLTFASAMGAVAHGFKMSEQLNRLLWQPLNLALGLTIAMFAVGVVYDRWGHAISKRVLPILVAVGVVFFGVTVVIPGSFLVFILYEAAAMLFALAVYVLLAARKQLAGAAVMAAGILITIVAAAIQASGAVFVKIIWEFDFNGIFHLIQVVGVVVLVAGLRTAMYARAGEAGDAAQ